MPVNVYQEVPTDGGKLLIFQGRKHQAPMVALIEEASWNRWRMWPGYDDGPLRNLGPVSIHTKVVGTVTQEYSNGTSIDFGKTLTFYGVVNDPAITWVEITLHERPDAPRKAPVVNGTWLVQWPSKGGDPPYPKARLRAGDDSGERYAVENVWD